MTTTRKLLRFIRRNASRLEVATGNNGFVEVGLGFTTIFSSVFGVSVALVTGAPSTGYLLLALGLISSILGLVVSTGPHSDYDY